MEDLDIHAKAAADRQWNLMRASFDGDWQGTTTWYGRNSDGMNMKQGTVNPEASHYAIRFSDAHTGEWHGTGLRFAPGGERRFPLYRTITTSATTAGIFRRLQTSRACKCQAAARVLGMK